MIVTIVLYCIVIRLYGYYFRRLGGRPIRLSIGVSSAISLCVQFLENDDGLYEPTQIFDV